MIRNSRGTTMSRENPRVRKKQILNAAVNLAIKVGYQQITRLEIAKSVGISVSLVTNYFRSMQKLKSEVMKEAIKEEIYEIIAQGLAVGDPQVVKLPKNVKKKVLTYLTK
jgi:AcrR family transcriptional regulator